MFFCLALSDVLWRLLWSSSKVSVQSWLAMSGHGNQVELSHTHCPDETLIFALEITMWVWTHLSTSRARSGWKKSLLQQLLLLLTRFWFFLIPLPRSVLVIVISIGILIVLTQSGQGLLFCSNFLSAGCRDWVVRQMVVIQAPLKSVNFTYKEGVSYST